jgi:5-methylcytosine-specific restriction endonuclease McrA
MPMKQCTRCKEHKALFQFNKDKRTKDGLFYFCRLCTNLNSKNHYKNKKIQYDVRDAKRRADKIQRTPKWIKDVFVDEIKVIYNRANLIKKFTGEAWHVDHIVPLKGKKVSGLHVPWNLQLLPASENLTKSNKFTPQ